MRGNHNLAERRLADALARLAGADLASLETRWRRAFGRAVPPGLSRGLIVRVLSFRLQAEALGDLDRETARALDRMAGQGGAAVMPLPDGRGSQPGTVLVREWQGVMQSVMVMREGYVWGGAAYRSLSEVAACPRWPAPSRARAGTGRASSASGPRQAERVGCNRAMRGAPHEARSAVRTIDTRVSTEHGLDQDFNSLDNLREAAEAYVKSQAVVVYKVDRLTRSLADFAKPVELFDRHGVSFVSVTQAFNTTTSMGRLTLNGLLSFAQFEREVTGERIRDKIAASKRKGLWMGGVVPLGYRVESRALHVVEAHADLIRTLFARYRELGSVMRLKCHLDQHGVVAPERIDGAERVSGGKPFSRGHLTKLLANPIYVGRLGHKGTVHDGQHPAIVAPSTFDAVQAQLAGNDHAKRQNRTRSTHLLSGRIRTADGKPMTPSHAQKGRTRYRYYLARAVLEGRCAASRVRRIAAPALETTVLASLRTAIGAKADTPDSDLIATHLKHVIVHPDRLELEIVGDDEAIVVPWSPASPQRRRDIIVPPGRERDRLRPMKGEDRTRILRAIAKARGWMRELTDGGIDGTAAITARDSITERSVRMTLSLAQLAPSIVTAIVAGRLPRGIAIRDLVELPASWAEQERALGLA